MAAAILLGGSWLATWLAWIFASPETKSRWRARLRHRSPGQLILSGVSLAALVVLGGSQFGRGATLLRALLVEGILFAGGAIGFVWGIRWARGRYPVEWAHQWAGGRIPEGTMWRIGIGIAIRIAIIGITIGTVLTATHIATA
jgi:hypothetical protein